VAIPEDRLIRGYQDAAAGADAELEIRARIKDIIVKEGKPHDVAFALRLSDGDLVQLLRLRERWLTLTIRAAADD
jgi:hypothetical protein